MEPSTTNVEPEPESCNDERCVMLCDVVYSEQVLCLSRQTELTDWTVWARIR